LLFSLFIIKTSSAHSKEVTELFPNVKPTDTMAFISTIHRFTKAMLKDTDQTIKEFALQEEPSPYKRIFSFKEEEKEFPTLPDDALIELFVFEEPKEHNSEPSEKEKDNTPIQSSHSSNHSDELDTLSSLLSSKEESPKETLKMSFEENKVIQRIRSLVKLKKLDETGAIFPVIRFAVGLGDYDEESEDLWNSKDLDEDQGDHDDEEDRKLKIRRVAYDGVLTSDSVVRNNDEGKEKIKIRRLENSVSNKTKQVKMDTFGGMSNDNTSSDNSNTETNTETKTETTESATLSSNTQESNDESNEATSKFSLDSSQDSENEEETPPTSIKNDSETIEENHRETKRVVMIAMEYYPDTIATILLGEEHSTNIEHLIDEDSQEESNSNSSDSSVQNSQSEEGDSEKEESEPQEFDIFHEAIEIYDRLMQKSVFLNMNYFFADLDCKSIYMKEVSSAEKEALESKYTKIYSHNKKLYNFVFKTVYDINQFTIDDITKLNFIPEKKTLQASDPMNHQILFVYQLSMWFIDFYLNKSEIFQDTAYVNQVFNMLSESESDGSLFESFDMEKLGFVFGETGDDVELGNLEDLQGAEIGAYSVKTPLLFNFMNYLLKNDRKQEKDIFLAFYKANEFTSVTAEVIEGLYNQSNTLADIFLRFYFYAKFERFLINTEKAKFVSPRAEFRERIEKLNEAIKELANALSTGVSEHEDMVQEIKDELKVLSEQTARNNYVDIILNGIRNAVLGYHEKVENLNYLIENMQRFREEQGKWGSKIGSIEEMGGDEVKVMRVEEFLEVEFRDSVSREDSFRLLVV
jgi:hypothetical protein